MLERVHEDEAVINCSLGTSVCDFAKMCVQHHLESHEMVTFADTVVSELQQLLSCDRKRRIALVFYGSQHPSLPPGSLVWHHLASKKESPV